MHNIIINTHSSICIDNNIYIDPFKIQNENHNAKLIFITHPHFDHLDIESIKNISNNSTIFICTKDSKNELLTHNINIENIIVLNPNESTTIDNIIIETFPSYNINKQFHPKNNNWIGYKITLENISYLICGDSDLTTELKQQKTDILFVPIGGVYTMNTLEAAELTNTINPKLVIHVHYGDIVGEKLLKDDFIKNLSKNINYKILI